MITWQHDNKTYALPDEWYWNHVDLEPNEFLNAVLTTFSFLDLNQSFKMGLSKPTEDIILLESGEEILVGEIPSELEDFFNENIEIDEF